MIINIQLFSSQLYEIIIDYYVRHSKMQSAHFVPEKSKPNNLQVARCDSGKLWIVSYNSTDLWVACCELIIRICVSLHYIKSALSVT